MAINPNWKPVNTYQNDPAMTDIFLKNLKRYLVKKYNEISPEYLPLIQQMEKEKGSLLSVSDLIGIKRGRLPLPTLTSQQPTPQPTPPITPITPTPQPTIYPNSDLTKQMQPIGQTQSWQRPQYQQPPSLSYLRSPMSSQSSGIYGRSTTPSYPMSQKYPYLAQRLKRLSSYSRFR